MVLIARTIIFKLRYKILGFQTGLIPNGLRPKILKAQMDLVRKIQFFLTYKTKPKSNNF